MRELVAPAWPFAARHGFSDPQNKRKNGCSQRRPVSQPASYTVRVRTGGNTHCVGGKEKNSLSRLGGSRFKIVSIDLIFKNF
jgi:hypothetical protein